MSLQRCFIPNLICILVFENCEMRTVCVCVYINVDISIYKSIHTHSSSLQAFSLPQTWNDLCVVLRIWRQRTKKKKTHNWMKHFLCCVEQASEVLLVLVLSAIIQCSGLISKLLLDKLVSCQDEGLEFSWQRSGKVHEELRCWMVQTEPVGWVCQSFVIWMKWQLMSKQNSDLVCVCITAH